MCAYNVLQPLQVYIAIIAQLNTIYLFVYTIVLLNKWIVSIIVKYLFIIYN